MPATRPIIIAGAGIGGLTLAIALARRGILSIVIERAPKLEEVGAGLQLSPNASRVLDRLGLGPEIDDAGIQPDSIRLMDGHSGQPIARMGLGFATETRWGAPYRLIHRAKLQSILARAVIDAGLSIRLGTELTHFVETQEGVAVHLKSRIANESMTGSALVGADGVRSIIRSHLGGGALAFSGQIAWRTTLPQGARRETAVWLGPGAHLVSYPLDRSGKLNLVAVTRGTSREGWAEPGDPSELLGQFAGWAEHVQTILRAAPEWTTWPLYDSPSPPEWGEGHITLLGDAAHPVLPHLAQGAALAIEDAAVLAARLAETPGDIASSFRAYEAERTPRAMAIQAAARRNGEIFRLGGIAAKARNTALRLMGEERFRARFDWVYGYRAA